MPIVNFSITKIDAERKEDEVIGKLNIKSDLKITNVAEEKLPVSSKSALKFSFQFVVDYEPKIGHIILTGYILYIPGDDEEDAKKIVETWKKTKKLDPKLMEILFNAILTKCNVKALIFSQEVNLPAHLRMPIVVADKQQDSKKKDAYIG